MEWIFFFQGVLFFVLLKIKKKGVKSTQYILDMGSDLLEHQELKRLFDLAKTEKKLRDRMEEQGESDLVMGEPPKERFVPKKKQKKVEKYFYTSKESEAQKISLRIFW